MQFSISYTKLSFSMDNTSIDSVPKKRTFDAYCFAACLVLHGKLASLRSNDADGRRHVVYVGFKAVSIPFAATLQENMSVDHNSATHTLPT